MTVSEAISNSSSIIIQLIDRIKDRQTAVLVGELQKNFFTIQQELVRLESENANLALDKRNFDSQIHNLKEAHRNEITNLTTANAKPKVDELDEIAEQMLHTLANNDPQNSVTDNELIQYFGLQKAKGDYLFALLSEREFVGSAGGQMGRGMFWFVTELGLKYLKSRGLLDSKPQKTIPSRSNSGAFRAGRRI